MKFRSEIDTLLAATLFGNVLVSVWAVYISGVNFTGAVVLLAIGAGLPLWLFLSTSYEIKAQTLHICCGPFRWNIPLSQVTCVTPSRSMVSSPALSLDRLRIEYGSGKVVLVSPHDQDSFLTALGKGAHAA